jgi:hypothetical protein
MSDRVVLTYGSKPPAETEGFDSIEDVFLIPTTDATDRVKGGTNEGKGRKKQQVAEQRTTNMSEDRRLEGQIDPDVEEFVNRYFEIVTVIFLL